MDIWADNNACIDLDRLAQSTCRKFVRQLQIGKHPQELVCDVPAYREMI